MALAGVRAADDKLADLLPRLKPTEPAEAMNTFHIAPGFKIELAACEPNVTDPVDIAWDENGKLYVCELWNYPGEPKPGEPLGRVRVLEDTKGDGVYDKSTIFADNIKWPSGIICWDGGVFVLSSPDMWYLKDTNGDAKADVKRRIFTGFKGKTYEVPNSLRWGVDGQVYVCGSYAGGSVMPVEKAKQTDPANSRDFRFDPRAALSTLTAIEAISGSGEFGNTLDDFGNRFTCDATNLIYHAVLPHDLLSNQFLAVTKTQESCYQSWAGVHAISPVEPWKAVREQFWSRWVNTNGDMNAGRFPPNELAPHGFATSAAGLTIYRGSAYGPDFAGDAFIGEPANNLVVRLKVEPRGVGFKATRPGPPNQEFLASTDNFFRPVNFANGPDGCLYVVSMYREVIEDESAIPNDIMKHLDLYSGRDRGRIYRIVPDRADWKRAPSPKMGKMTDAELIASLNSPDGWTRDTAQRLLIQRKRDVDPASLTKLVSDAANPAARVQALWTLSAIAGPDDSPDSKTVAAAMADKDARVRENAIWVSLRGCSPAMVLNKQSPATPKLPQLADDPGARVRLAAAFALGHQYGSDLNRSHATVAALARLAKRDAGDPWIRTAVLSATDECGEALLEELLADKGHEFMNSPTGADFIGDITQVIGGRFDEEEITRFLIELNRHGPNHALPLLHHFVRGMALTGKIFAEYFDGPTRRNHEHMPLLRKLFGIARETALDVTKKEGERLEALDLLASDPFNGIEGNFGPLLGPAQAPPIQIAAIKALAGRGESNIGALLVGQWRHLGPAARPEVIDALLRRPERVLILLDAMEKKIISPADIAPGQKAKLSKNKDESIRTRAKKLLGAGASPDRQKVIDEYRAAIQKLPGDAAKGKEIFNATCIQCHGEAPGHPRVGPDLAKLEDRSPDTLLINILDPNRDVKPIYVGYTIVTHDGQDYTGVIAGETAVSVAIRHPLGEETVLRKNIKSLTSSGLSLMPDGLEAGMNPQGMADLIVFLRTYR
jgi:putative membrane-bound dehydrogenase-like protein